MNKPVTLSYTRVSKLKETKEKPVIKISPTHISLYASGWASSIMSVLLAAAVAAFQPRVAASHAQDMQVAIALTPWWDAPFLPGDTGGRASFRRRFYWTGTYS